VSFPDFVVTYFTDRLTLLSLALLYSMVAGLFLVFRANRENPRIRSRVLVSMFTILTVNWTFVASSLVLCQALLGLYEVDALAAVKAVFGLGLLVSLASALPLSLFISLRLPDIMAKRLSTGLSDAIDPRLTTIWRPAQKRSFFKAKLLWSPSTLPFVYSVGSRDNVVVISEGIVRDLDSDELEAVLVHEMAHLRNKDTRLGTIMAVYKKFLFFDPLVRLIESAVHREREFIADEFSAKETGKPLSLASALIKIHSAYSTRRSGRLEGLSIVGRTNLFNSPILEERIQRLLRIARELEKKQSVFAQASTPTRLQNA